jgi:hypothetical protein
MLFCHASGRDYGGRCGPGNGETEISPKRNPFTGVERFGHVLGVNVADMD